jgi:hypothetical protein
VRNTRSAPSHGTSHGLTLAGVAADAAMWPTPKASVTGGTEPADRRGKSLHTMAMWPTPTAQDDQKSPEAHMAMKARMEGGTRKAITSLTVMANRVARPREAS